MLSVKKGMQMSALVVALAATASSAQIQSMFADPKANQVGDALTDIDEDGEKQQDGNQQHNTGCRQYPGFHPAAFARQRI
jgi:flagellar basal body L-ring protein FlgH